uniref:Uncharacterized protein n=1 Tax=Anguilla anguilla TaxID=7936 RepID=A0A0E9WLL7_ANGAN
MFIYIHGFNRRNWIYLLCFSLFFVYGLIWFSLVSMTEVQVRFVQAQIHGERARASDASFLK